MPSSSDVDEGRRLQLVKESKKKKKFVKSNQILTCGVIYICKSKQQTFIAAEMDAIHILLFLHEDQ